MTRIVQVLPRLPPAVCGVGDQSTILARALKAGHQIDTHFIACDPRSEVPAATIGFSTSQVSGRKPDSLLRLMISAGGGTKAVVLQLSGYGFSKRGAPAWLLPVLRKFRQRFPAVPLITMFHELYVNGPVTSSAFWIKPLQQWVLRGIARASDVVRTNRHEYARWLAGSRGCDVAEIATFPIFSNLGESPAFVPFADRQHRIVLFQPPALSGPDGQAYWECWRRIRQRWPDIRTIAAGRCAEPPVDDTIERAGYVSAAAAAEIMRDSTLGIIDYYDGYLAKSSIFAAFAAHGLGYILPRANRSEADGIRPGEHYLDAPKDGGAPEMPLLEQLARRLHAWYAPHSSTATAASFADSISRAIDLRMMR